MRQSPCRQTPAALARSPRTGRTCIVGSVKFSGCGSTVPLPSIPDAQAEVGIFRFRASQISVPSPKSFRSALVAVAVLLALVLQGCAQTQVQATPPNGAKRVVVDKTLQMLSAYEGERLVFQSRVSTGRPGRRTPSGDFYAGIKLRMHYSRLYDNAPMPWSVQFNGNFFIHGFTSVPDRPASHGCVRLPLTGDNPAKWFFDWVEPGTPIAVTGEWAGKPKPQPSPKPPVEPDAQ